MTQTNINNGFLCFLRESTMNIHGHFAGTFDHDFLSDTLNSWWGKWMLYHMLHKLEPLATQWQLPLACILMTHMFRWKYQNNQLGFKQIMAFFPHIKTSLQVVCCWCWFSVYAIWPKEVRFFFWPAIVTTIFMYIVSMS